jgi:protein-disulfide isomerase
MRVFSRFLVLGGVVLGAGLAAAAGEEQLIKYYRKKSNVPPAATVTVTGLKDSAVKGLKEGTLEIGQGPQTRKVPFVASADMKYAVFAGLEDVTSDPSKAVMAKIDLKGEPAKGPATAKVTIVEYSDFQCPFCTRGYNTIEKQVLKEYGDKVRFYYKHYPLAFHNWAETSAVGAECAKEQKPDAYWKLYSMYFENQQQVKPENIKEKSLEWLKDTGVDAAKWTECFDNKKTLAKVKAQMAEGQAVGVQGTPGFIINGRLLSGAQPFESFKAIIDDELASAK